MIGMIRLTSQVGSLIGFTGYKYIGLDSCFLLSGYKKVSGYAIDTISNNAYIKVIMLISKF